MPKKNIKSKNNAKKMYIVWIEAIDYENKKDGLGENKNQKVKYYLQEDY